MKLKNELRMMNKNLIPTTVIFFKGLKRLHVFKKIIDNKILCIKN